MDELKMRNLNGVDKKRYKRTNRSQGRRRVFNSYLRFFEI